MSNSPSKDFELSKREGMSLAAEDYAGWKNWADTNFMKPSAWKVGYFSAEIELIKPQKTKLNILEVGFGNGEFLGWCRLNGHPAQGVEVIPQLVDRAMNLGVPCHDSIYSESLDECLGGFDLIVAFDVLEHIAANDIQRFLVRIRDLLGGNGVLLARVPNGDSPFGRRYQHGDITHCITFGSGKIRQLAEMCGLGVDVIREPAVSIGRVGRFFRKMLEGIIAKLYFDGIRFPMSPNIVAVLRKTDC